MYAEKSIAKPILRTTLTHRLTIGIASLLVVFVLLYLGAYFALVRKTYRLMGINPANGFNWFEIDADYSMGGHSAQRFFAPAHAVDRLVRSGHWETVEDPDAGSYRNPRPNGR
jgi:hypothetical protein